MASQPCVRWRSGGTLPDLTAAYTNEFTALAHEAMK